MYASITLRLSLLNHHQAPPDRCAAVVGGRRCTRCWLSARSANADWGEETNAGHILDTPESCQQKQPRRQSAMSFLLWAAGDTSSAGSCSAEPPSGPLPASGRRGH